MRTGNSARHFQYLFGPVPSRRLGISLGVDLVPHKVCGFNCVYCECGATTNLTLDRREYVPADDVLTELAEYFRVNPWPEVVTFSGAGEPLLHSGLGRIISVIKQTLPVPLVLITSSILLDRPEVRAEIKPCQLVLPSLDAATDETFRKINRPHPAVCIESVIDGLAALRTEMDGEMWLEIFLLEGINTSPAELDALRRAVARIAPHRVQLNSLDRPGTEDWVRKIPMPRMEEIAAAFAHPRVEIITRYRRRQDLPAFRSDQESSILETLARRPCTAADLAESTGLDPSSLGRYLDILENEKRVRPEIQERGIFYRLVQP